MLLNQQTLQQYRDGANRGVGWLLSRLNPDGSFQSPIQDLACYYKSPYLFFLSGHGGKANRVLGYIGKTFMRSDGDFSTTPECKSANAALAEYRAYMNGWLAIASQKMGAFNVAFRARSYLQAFYHLGNGGGTTRHLYGEGDNTVDALSSAHLGLAALYFGDKERALAAGNVLRRMLELQPHATQEFLLRLDNNGKLISEFPSDQSVFYAVSMTQPNQAYFMLGYPVGFLGKLYEATGDSSVLNSATAYLEILLSSRGNLQKFYFSHKVAWGSAIIARITKEPQYLQLSQEIAHYLLSIQSPSGAWLEDQPAFTTFDQTAEIAIWLFEIANELSAIDELNSR